MSQRYFRIANDMTTGRRAFLSFPPDDGNDQYLALMRGMGWDGPMPRLTRTAGWLPEWNTISGSTIPVVSARVGAMLAELAGPDVQRIPVALEGDNGGDGGTRWEVLGLRMIDCADGERTDVFHALKATIDGDRAAGAKIFRLPSFVLVIDGDVYDLFIREGVDGAEYHPLPTR